MITENQLNKKGVITRTITDYLGVKFVLSIFQFGLIVNCQVYSPNGKLIKHYESSSKDFASASAMYENTLKAIKNKNNNIHYRMINLSDRIG